jgi:hypothetical protein
MREIVDRFEVLGGEMDEDRVKRGIPPRHERTKSTSPASAEQHACAGDRTENVDEMRLSGIPGRCQSDMRLLRGKCNEG